MFDEKRISAPLLICPSCGSYHAPGEAHHTVSEAAPLPGDVPDDPTQAQMLSALEALTAERAELDQVEAELVTMLRNLKTPWPIIGRTLGLSKDAVIRRHGTRN